MLLIVLLSLTNLLNEHQSGVKTAHGSHAPLPVRGSSTPLAVLSITDCAILVHIPPDKLKLSGHMEWLHVQTLHFWHQCPSRLSTGTPSVLPIYSIMGFCVHISWFHQSLQSQLFLTFPSSDSILISTCISECLSDISTWTTVHHLKLNLQLNLRLTRACCWKCATVTSGVTL